MTPDEMEEMLGAYALDAVSDDERREIEAYLANNPRARDEVTQHREVATLLAFTGTEAPTGLWDKIASSLDDRAPAPGAGLAAVLSLEDRRPRRRWVSAAAVGAAAAAAAVIAVLGVNVHQPRTPTLREAASAAMRDEGFRKTHLASTDKALSLSVAVQGSSGYLLADQLPELPADRTYQLWGVIDGKVISLGVLGRHPGVVVFAANPQLSALALTNETSGGVAVSKETPLASGQFT